jgi:hypothetical protein
VLLFEPTLRVKVSSAQPYGTMRKRTYREHVVELVSEEARAGEWVARATIIVDFGKTPKRIPIFGRRRATFESQRQADSYAMELAKLWIDGRLWGANGHG